MSSASRISVSEDLVRVCQVMDSIVTLDVGARGAIGRLYSASRALSELPLSLAAAKGLVESLEPGRPVFLVTGSLARNEVSLDIGESDGPPGVASMALTLRLALGAAPVIATDKPLVPRTEAMLAISGFCVVPIEMLAAATMPSRRPTCAASVISMSTDLDAAAKEAAKLIEIYRPGAIVSCERHGPNRFGVLHNAQGRDVSQHRSRVDQLFKVAYETEGGPFTTSFADGGNEIGIGNVAEDLRTWLPYGAMCQCPCKGGIVPETKVDVLVPATVSNWGAYAVSAAIALLIGKPEHVPTTEREARIIRATAQAGFIDSPTGRTIDQVDGIPLESNLAIVRLLAEAAASGFTTLAGASAWDKPIK